MAVSIPLPVRQSSNYPAQPGWYQQYLHRPIDGVGGNAGASLMDQGVPQDSILTSILASNEYYGRA